MKVKRIIDVQRMRLVWGGCLLGGWVGFMLRPAVPVIGKLPLLAVLTRGVTFSGLQLVLKDNAVRSFNLVVAGALMGGVLTAVIVTVVRQRSAGVVESDTPDVPSPEQKEAL